MCLRSDEDCVCWDTWEVSEREVKQCVSEWLVEQKKHVTESAWRRKLKSVPAKVSKSVVFEAVWPPSSKLVTVSF